MLCDIAPPVGQRTEGVGRVGRLPVDLRRDVVDGALFQPGQRVTEDAVKLPVTARGARSHTMLTCRCAGGACHAGRADAKSHLGLGLLYHVVHIGDHHVDVVAAPVGKRHIHARVIPQVIVRCASIGGNTVGVEVVVKDDAVHIIFGDDFPDDIDDALAGGREAGIEDRIGR